jgi:hypothetical protein
MSVICLCSAALRRFFFAESSTGDRLFNFIDVSVIASTFVVSGATVKRNRKVLVPVGKRMEDPTAS